MPVVPTPPVFFPSPPALGAAPRASCTQGVAERIGWGVGECVEESPDTPWEGLLAALSLPRGHVHTPATVC